MTDELPEWFVNKLNESMMGSHPAQTGGKMTNILHQYNDYMALVEIGGGYDIPARIEKSKLLKLLDELPSGDIYVSMVPHQDGKCVIVKPCNLTEPTWWLLCPKEDAK